ncbi:hypothetical protein IKF15_00800 [Candidatus Saccharibacteria bacterium]|nr:hypothetical protein [Candidatus Saccharibacteria bacterium]
MSKFESERANDIKSGSRDDRYGSEETDWSKLSRIDGHSGERTDWSKLSIAEANDDYGTERNDRDYKRATEAVYIGSEPRRPIDNESSETPETPETPETIDGDISVFMIKEKVTNKKVEGSPIGADHVNGFRKWKRENGKSDYIGDKYINNGIDEVEQYGMPVDGDDINAVEDRSDRRFERGGLLQETHHEDNSRIEEKAKSYMEYLAQQHDGSDDENSRNSDENLAMQHDESVGNERSEGVEEENADEARDLDSYPAIRLVEDKKLGMQYDGSDKGDTEEIDSSGLIEDVEKARIMAMAENPYRTEAQVLKNKADSLLYQHGKNDGKMENSKIFKTSLKESGKFKRRADNIVEKGVKAAEKAGRQYDKMMGA